MGEGFTWETQDRQRDIAAAQAAWAVSRQLLQDPGVQFVVLDELNIALKHGYLDLDQVLSDIQARPPMQHVIVTGRAAKPEMIELADTVTEMGMLKHAFQAGIRAQKASNCESIAPLPRRVDRGAGLWPGQDYRHCCAGPPAPQPRAQGAGVQMRARLS